jgi:hypothetical protein
MEKKRQSINQVANVVTVPNTTHKRKYKNRVIKTQFVKATPVNYESMANMNLDHLGLVCKLTDALGNITYLYTNSQDVEYTKDGRPRFKYIIEKQRVGIIDQIKSYGNTPSGVVARVINIGINAHQIGGIRRWYHSDWRTKPAKI